MSSPRRNVVLGRLAAVLVMLATVVFCGATLASFANAHFSRFNLVVGWIGLPVVLGLLLAAMALIARVLWTGGPS